MNFEAFECLVFGIGPSFYISLYINHMNVFVLFSTCKRICRNVDLYSMILGLCLTACLDINTAGCALNNSKVCVYVCCSEHVCGC